MKFVKVNNLYLIKSQNYLFIANNRMGIILNFIRIH